MESSPSPPDHGQEQCPQPPSEQQTDTLFVQARDAMVAIGSMVAYTFRNPVESYLGVAPTLHELTMGLMGSSFRPERDIMDLTGKVIFVTGGSFLIFELVSKYRLTPSPLLVDTIQAIQV